MINILFFVYVYSRENTIKILQILTGTEYKQLSESAIIVSIRGNS